MSDTTNNPFEHILYEIKMYLYSQLKLIPDGIENELVLHNMIVDSRAIHLRNLADFFIENKVSKTKYWHFSDYVDNGSVNGIKKDLYRRIQRYTSQATCHLVDQRLKETFKDDTLDCVQDALPEMTKLIRDFISDMNYSVKKEYQDKWKNHDIQGHVAEIESLLPIFERYCESQMYLGTTE